MRQRITDQPLEPIPLASRRREGARPPDGPVAPPVIPFGALLQSVKPAWLDEEPPVIDWLLTVAQTGAGVIPMGRVGLLSARGGSGKSYLLTQLAVSVATGGTWLGEGDGWTARQGRVLLVMAEETVDEVRRRTYRCAQAVSLSSTARAEVVAAVDVVAAAGHGVALTRELAGVGEELPETARAEELREMLRAAKRAGKPYTLVGLDPLSRLAGADVEKDPAAATRFLQVAETLTAPDCGSPAVVIACHARKGMVGRNGQASEADPESDVRGSSALVDGARWVLFLAREHKVEHAPELLQLTLSKSNYSRRTELQLIQPEEWHGPLRAATKDERDQYKEAREAARRKKTDRPAPPPKPTLEQDMERVLEELAKGPRSRNELAKLLSRRAPDVSAAIKALEREGKVERRGGARGDYALATNHLLDLPTAPTPGVVDRITGARDPVGGDPVS